ncbi:MAG: hypothetical protein Q9191_003756 [Dirinaria sp. TL-2023a]
MSVIPPTIVESRPFSPVMMSLRSHQQPYRSLPGTPMGMDPRALATMDIGPSLNHARSSLQVDDYFSGAPRYGTAMKPRSPYVAVPNYEQEQQHMQGSPEMAMDSLTHMINRTNLAASLINIQISPTAKYAKIFPHMCDDGSFPVDFRTPKTVETMRVLDNSQLDRIMQSYRLPLDLRSITTFSSRETTHSSTRVRQAKLHSLWEYLGAHKLLEYDKMRKGMI